MLRILMCSLIKDSTSNVCLFLLVWPLGAENRHVVFQRQHSCAHDAPGIIPAQSNPPPGGRPTAAFKAQSYYNHYYDCDYHQYEYHWPDATFLVVELLKSKMLFRVACATSKNRVFLLSFLQGTIQAPLESTF